MAVIVKRFNPKNILSGQSVKGTIVGENFISPVSIILNGSTLSPTLVTPNIVMFIIPSIAKGTYNVVVKNGDGTKWMCTSALNVTDNASINSKLGSAAYPIVMPQRVIESSPTSKVNNSSRNLQYSTPASVTFNADTNTIVATKEIISTDETMGSNKISSTSYDGKTINSPWGSFKNE